MLTTDSVIREDARLTPSDGLHARLQQDCLLDLEYPALVLLDNLQRLVDNCIR